MKEKEEITAKQIEEIAESIINYFEQSEEDKKAVDFVTEELIKNASVDEIFDSMVKTVSVWTTNLSILESQEEFEIYAKVVRVIDYEIMQAIELMYNHKGFSEVDIMHFKKRSEQLINKYR